MTKKELIPSITGLRAVSILMVLLYHFNQRGFLPSNKLITYLGWFLFNGQLGVNIFFILSGFLITTLLIAEREKNGFISLKQFYIRRTFRIFPAYYFFVFVIFILQVLHYFDFPLVAWLSLITYTKQFFPFYGHEIEHLWSLSVEEFFYLIWPICFIKFKKPTTFIYIMIGVIVLLRFTGFDYPHGKFANSIASTGDALLIGCLVALKRPLFDRFVDNHRKKIYLLPLLLVASIIVYNLSYYLGDRYSFLLILQKSAYALFGSIGLFTNLLLAVFIIYCIRARTVVYRALNTKILIYIGTLSYSIYLWQQLFTADRAWLHHTPFVLVLVYISLASLFSFYVVERPFLIIKQKFEVRRSANRSITHSSNEKFTS